MKGNEAYGEVVQKDTPCQIIYESYKYLAPREQTL